MSDEVINTQAFVIQDQLRTISNLRCVIADLTRQCQESDALLRQALDQITFLDRAANISHIANPVAEAIKQHLGDETAAR